MRVPSLGPDRSLHLLNIRSVSQSSTVKLAAPEKSRTVGASGHRPYMETKCCRLRKTTTRVKNGAHGAHAADPVEDEGLIVGSIEIHTVPMAARAQMGFGLQLDSGEDVLAGGGTVSV